MLTPVEKTTLASHAADALAIRPRILVCAPRYLPGFKSGGPVRSVSNMIENLQHQFDFYVVTRDRDAADVSSYPGVEAGCWQEVGPAHVLYCRSIKQTELREAYNFIKPDVILLNSFHDTFTRSMLHLRRKGVFAQTPVILAPRGEFSPGALEIKRVKKLVYRVVARMIGLYENLLWQATSSLEKDDLLNIMPARSLRESQVFVTGNITEAIPAQNARPSKRPGEARFVFLSRISEKKNLHYFLDLLAHTKDSVQFDIFGPIAEKDMDYWEKCQAIYASLPANVSVSYGGAVDHSRVSQLLRDYHFFVLPTKGENFCHAAVESFLSGTPVIMSDQTPWIGLSASRAGFDISLDDPGAWLSAFKSCLGMDQREYDEWSAGALDFGRQFSTEKPVLEHLKLFEVALQSKQHCSINSGFQHRYS